MLELEVLVFKLSAVDGATAGAVVVREIAALGNKQVQNGGTKATTVTK